MKADGRWTLSPLVFRSAVLNDGESFTVVLRFLALSVDKSITEVIRGCIQKFPDWPPGARATNGTTALCH
jgi:hypothetical protein